MHLSGSRLGSTPQRALIWAVTGLALLVVALCFASSDGVLAGSIAATRYSARLSGIVLAFALAARAPWPLAARRAQLALAFVAAHGVHYATVIGRAVVEPGNRLRHPAAESLVVVGGGVALLGLVAMTARSTSTVGARTNAIAFYIAWAALTLASASRVRTSLPSVVVLGVLVLALLACRFSAGSAPGFRSARSSRD
jgi:hypothetical protein